MPTLQELLQNQSLSEVPTHHSARDYLRVLMVIAAPVWNDGGAVPEPLDVWREWQKVVGTLREKQAPVLLVRVLPSTLDKVARSLGTAQPAEGYHIVHFIGHGSPDGLALEDDYGRLKIAPAEKLAAAFAASGVHLVILNVCESEGPGRALIAAGIPAVIATRTSVPDHVAKEISAALYAALATGHSLGEAFDNVQVLLRGSFAPYADQWMLLGRADFGFPNTERRNRPIIVGEPSRNNLPTTYGFVGRGEELVTLAEKLEQTALRALSLHGMSGIGKTTLMAEAAHRNIWRFPGGAVYVAAAGQPFSEIMVQMDAVLRLGLQEATVSQWEQLALDYIKENATLLVLDNVDQMLPAERQRMVAFLRRIPPYSGSKALLAFANYRKELKDLDALFLLPLKGLDNQNAIRLLRNEARRLGFQDLLKAEERELVAIARRFAGHPLMLMQLAGLEDYQRIRAVAETMRGRLRLKMNQVMSEALDGLGAEEGKLLARLIIFADSMDYTAITTICGEEGSDIDSAIERLQDRALLDYDRKSGRYRLHPFVERYVLENLPLSAEDDFAIRRRHAEHYLQHLKAIRRTLESEPRQGRQLLEADGGNLRQAVRWARDRSQSALVQNYALTLHVPLMEAGHWQEDKLYLEWGIQASEGQTEQRKKAMLLGELALVEMRLELYEQARQHAEQSVTLFEQLGAGADTALALQRLGSISAELRLFDIAHQCYKRALAIQRAGKNKIKTLRQLGDLLAAQELYVEAENYYNAAVEMAEERGDGEGLTILLRQLGLLYAVQGKDDAALEHFSRALSLAQGNNDEIGIARCQQTLGDFYLNRGKLDDAEAAYTASLSLGEARLDRLGMAYALRGLGDLAVKRRQYEQAHEHYERSLTLAQEIGKPKLIEELKQALRHLPL